MKKEELKELFNSFTRDDYYKNVDLHIHSNESDGEMTPYEILEEAKKNDKKYMAIADHNTIDAYLSTNILREKMIIPAVEFDCFYKGIMIHILGYGFDIDNEEMKTLYAKNSAGKNHNIFRIFNLRNPEEVIKKISEAGGISVLAHPCCYPTFTFEEFIRDLIDMGLDGVELYYPYRGFRKIFKFQSRKELANIVEKFGIIKTGGTDSHGKKLYSGNASL